MSMRFTVQGASTAGAKRADAVGNVTTVALPLAGEAPPTQLAPVPQLSLAPAPFQVVEVGASAVSVMSLPVPPTYEICSVAPLKAIVAPSGNPAKFPVTASAPSLATITKVSPENGA